MADILVQNLKLHDQKGQKEVHEYFKYSTVFKYVIVILLFPVTFWKIGKHTSNFRTLERTFFLCIVTNESVATHIKSSCVRPQSPGGRSLV